MCVGREGNDQIFQRGITIKISIHVYKRAHLVAMGVDYVSMSFWGRDDSFYRA